MKLQKFSSFLAEARGFISASGADATRHKAKYIDPHVGSTEPTHVVGKEHGELGVGTQVRIHSTHEEGGKLHAVVSSAKSRKKITIPVSKLHKPGAEAKNKGLDYEHSFVERMKQHGLADPKASGAGSTAGTDVTLINKKKKTTHPGKVSSSQNVFRGEVKQGVSAAMGQLTIRHTKERGWHIPEEARARRPKYAQAIEEAGILHHMNEHHDPDKGVETTASGRAKTVVIKHDHEGNPLGMGAAEAYLQDHHAQFVHIGGHGTYRVGSKDATEHGLPRLEGKGKFLVREKQFGNKKSRTVMFQPDGKKNLTPSHVDLDNDEHLEAFKKTLGHK